MMLLLRSWAISSSQGSVEMFDVSVVLPPLLWTMLVWYASGTSCGYHSTNGGVERSMSASTTLPSYRRRWFGSRA